MLWYGVCKFDGHMELVVSCDNRDQIQEDLRMAESIVHQNKRRAPKRGKTSFNGAVKSKNEIYFQMASLFREASKGKQELSGQWIDRILKAQQAKIPGKFYRDNL